LGIPGKIIIDPSGAITATPHRPFHGTAEFQPKRGATGSWLGTLTAVFPGKGAIPLAGPTFLASRAS
jgi:hypothetical protein